MDKSENARSGMTRTAAGKKKLPDRRSLIGWIIWLCLSVLLGMGFSFLLFSERDPDLLLFGGETVEVISLDPDASLELNWLYQADLSVETTGDISSYPRVADISFDRLVKEGVWQRTKENYLSTKESGARLKLPYRWNEKGAVVYSFLASGGNAVIALDANGSRKLFTISGKDRDAFQFSAASQGNKAFFSGLLIPGLLLSFLFFLAGFLIHHSRRQSIPAHRCGCGFRKNLLPCLLAFGIPFGIGLVVCAFNGFSPFGEKTFLTNDMFWQNADFLSGYRTLLREHQDLFYSFTKGLGGETVSYFAYYLASPLNLLIMLFSAESMPEALTFFVLLRLGLCGACCCLFLCILSADPDNETEYRLDRKSMAAVLFSTAYALSSFAIAYADSSKSLDGMILLPLTAAALLILLRRGKPIFYILSLCASLIINFYTGYMICIFSVLFFLYWLAAGGAAKRRKQILSFLSSSLIGGGLAGLLLIPIIFSLTSGPKSLKGGQFDFSLNFFPPDLFSKNYLGVFSISDLESGLPFIYCGMLVNLLVLLYFLNRQITAREKWASLAFLMVLLSSFFLNFPNLAWQGFNPPALWPYRYAFVFNFALVTLACRCFLAARGVRRRDLIISFVILLTLSGFFYVRIERYDYLQVSSLCCGMLISLVGCILLGLNGTSGKNTCRQLAALSILLCADLGLNAGILWQKNFAANREKGTATYASEYQDYQQKIEPLVSAVKANETDFFRMENMLSVGEDESLRFDYAGISHFSSTISTDQLQFLKKLGFSQPFYAIHYGEGSTVAADSLLGIKYLIGASGGILKPYEEKAASENASLYANPFALPMGFMTGRRLLSCDIHSDNPFEVQNRIYSCLTENTEEILSPAGQISRETINLREETADGSTRWEKIDTAQDAWLTWTLTIETKDPLYAYFPVPSRRGVELYLNGGSIGIYMRDPRRYGMVPLGSFAPGETVTFSMRLLENDVVLLDELFYYENLDQLADAVHLLSKPSLKMRVSSGSRVEGSVDGGTEGGWLFLSIPYDEAWQIRVDGQLVRSERVLDVLSAIPVAPGQHQIRMRYIPQGLFPGILLSLLSLFALLFFCFPSASGKEKS